MSAPLLNTRLQVLWRLDEFLQRQLLDVRSNLDLFNEEVDEARYFLRLTFNVLESEMRNLVNSSLDATYLRMADRAKLLVECIDRVSHL